MTDPDRSTVRVDAPEVSNVIEVGELLRALQDFAAREAGSPARAVRLSATNSSGDLAQVERLAGELAELVNRIPDFPAPRRSPPS
jgi:hypothetical protein